MLKNYWLVAIRKLWKHKAHTAINILGLTIGLTSCLVIYLLTRFELSTDRFHPGGDRIYRVVASMGDSLQREPMPGLGTGLPLAIDAQMSGLEAVAPFYVWGADVTIPGKEEKKFDRPKYNEGQFFIITTPGYFKTFNYQWLAGSPTTSLSEPFTVVLTVNEMRRYFGPIDPDQAIGRQVIYQDSLRTTVTGIVKDWGPNTDFGFRNFISLATIQHSWLNAEFGPEQYGNWMSAAQALVRLEKGVKPPTVEAQFQPLLNKYPHPGAHVRLMLQPLADIHFNEAWPDNYSHKAHLPTLYGLMGIAVFILLLAIVNFVNLATAQSLQRTKEIGIRKVLGSRRGDIALQFLGETFLLTSLAVLLSVLIARPVMNLMHSWLPPGLPFDLSPANLLFLLALTVVTSLLAGWYPARVISALLPVLSLKGLATRALSPNRYLHRALIVFQFAISLVFIIGTVVVARQLNFVLNSDLGFDKDAIFTVRPTGRSTPRQLQVAAQEINTLPGVSLVSRDMGTPAAAGVISTNLEYHGPTDRKFDASFEGCDPSYIPLFGLRLVAGRNLSPGDTTREILVNETFARTLGFLHPRDAVGKQVESGDTHLTITGVIKDFHENSMHRAIQPFFFTTDNRWLRAISIRLSPAGRNLEAVRNVLAGIARLWPTIFPNKKFNYTFFDDDIAKLYEKEQKTSGLLRLTMVIAILISCMGLLGLATFAAEQRNKEVSIRKVLGASVMQVASMLTANFLWPVLLAIVIATPVAWYFVHSWLQDFAYRISIPWWIFGLCGMAAVAIAMLTVGYQAVRAAIRNPVESLRSE